MHYYQFNIADYRKDTQPLTPVQHYMYRWLIDEYHLTEQPFNNDMTKLLWRMGMDEGHRESLELILDHFFTPAADEDYKPVNLSEHPEIADIGDYPETCQYWIHPRIDKDIAAFRELKEKKSRAGKASGKSRKQKNNASRTPVQQKNYSVELTNNHKPITNNQEPKIKTRASPFVIPSQKEVSEYCNERKNAVHPQTFIDFYESKGWMIGKNKMKCWKAAVRTWEKKGNGSERQGQNTGFDNRGRAQKVSDKLDEIARKAIDRGEAF